MPEGTRVVCILPDSIRNYMTKHLMDEWMWERDFFTPEGKSKILRAIKTDKFLSKILNGTARVYASYRGTEKRRLSTRRRLSVAP